MEVFYVVLLVLIVSAIISQIIYQNKVGQEGIEAKGVVRIEEEVIYDEDNIPNINYNYFVSFKTASGKTAEAQIGDPKISLKDGDKVLIKYLEKNTNYAVFVKKV